MYGHDFVKHYADLHVPSNAAHEIRSRGSIYNSWISQSELNFMVHVIRTA